MGERIERDLLGNMSIPENAYYGIHTARSLDNFPLGDQRVNRDLIQSMIMVKKACALANMETGLLTEDIGKAISGSCDYLLSLDLEDAFITHPLQGGAGTSTNMNINEVIANVAIERLGGKKGNYTIVHPINHVNCSQSTNDVYPTAIRIAAIFKIRKLADQLAKLQESLQIKENQFASILKLGRTQLNDALPITLGQEFGAYARCISRDRWRIYKVEERLREINLGGTAIGTGLNAPLEYIYSVTEHLQKVTNLGLARSDLLVDTTQNMDVFVEVSGLLKACGVNLIKISNDIRLMASGPRGGLGELILEPRQSGSSIMPGKVNPVICEMMIQIGYQVIGNDTSITAAAAAGQLELNAFSPLLAHCLLESLDLLVSGITSFNQYCISTLEADEKQCMKNVNLSTSLSAALINYIGYDIASAIALEALDKKKTITEILIEKDIMKPEEIENIFNVFQVTKPGIPGRSNP